MQVAGRLALHSIEWLRPQINQSLLPLRAEVVGAAGDWQGFNPVLRAERVVFPAGNLRNVYVELDFSQRPQWVMGAATLLQPKRRGRCRPLRHGLAAQKQSRSALEYRFSANRQCQRIP